MTIAQITKDLRDKGYTLTPTRYDRVFVGGIGRSSKFTDRIWRLITIDNPDADTAAEGANERVSWYRSKAEALSTLTDEYVCNYFGADDAAKMGVNFVNVETVAQIEARQSLARGLADSAAGRVADRGDFTQYAHDAPAREWPIHVSDDIDVMVTLTAGGELSIDITTTGQINGDNIFVTINDEAAF